jgi:hypothetical protein
MEEISLPQQSVINVKVFVNRHYNENLDFSMPYLELRTMKLHQLRMLMQLVDTTYFFIDKHDDIIELDIE